MKQSILLLIIILPTFMHWYEDFTVKIKTNGDLDKKEDILSAVLLSLFSSLWFGLQFDDTWWKVFILQGSFHFLVFDYAISITAMKMGFFYLGKTSTTDKILKKVNPWLLLFIRLGFMAGAILIYRFI